MGNEASVLPLPSAPYRGIEPFRFIDQPIFSARTGEVRKLIRLITIYRGIFFYGESGVGKSSLINAGLIPALRDEGFAPERVRVQPFAEKELVVERIALTEEGAPPFLSSRFAVPLENCALGPARIVLSVEEFARRIEEQQPTEESEIAERSSVTPVLIFDQFEELVTLFEEAVESRDKFNQARMIQSGIVGLLLRFLNDPALSLKLVFSFREDYLAKVSRCLADAPQLGEQAFRLSSPPETALRKVIRGPFENPTFPAGHFRRRLSEPACEALESAFKEMSDSGTINLTEVQIACLALWESEKEETAFLNETDRREAVRSLFGNHLDAALNDLEPRFRKPAITALTYLVTSSGTRNIVSEEDLIGNLIRDEHLTESDGRGVLQALSRRTRLVLRQARGDSAFYEITSEFLIPWIREKRERQRAERVRAEQLAQKRKQLITTLVACLLALTLIATIWGGYYFLFQEHVSYYRNFGKRLGFPVGIAPISKAEAQRLPVSLLLVHKGITREGWTLRWKPAFRMVAVNGNSEYTTDHGIGTYLYSEEEGEDARAIETRQRAQSLGLHRVCQWEFVSDAQGNIAYERGLDRSGRMVWGLVYSPGGLDAGSTRRARFVGPDGFSQLQRGSSAEYVEIHYGKEGWEERVMFHDARNLPAIGPDGAFGRKMTYDAHGLRTSVLSLDAKGREMVDNVGNCGVLIAYNEKAVPIEFRSVGPDLNPMSVTDGYILAKYQYDEFGRPQRLTFYGASGEPCASQGRQSRLDGRI